MRSYYPRSFLKLVLAGLTLVTLPSLVVLIGVAAAVDRLTLRSETAVQRAASATQASRRVGELTAALERSARQFEILGDPDTLANYRATRERLLKVVASFPGAADDQEQLGRLAHIRATEADIFAVISNEASGKQQVSAAVARFVTLGELTREVVARSNELIDEEIESVRNTGNDVRAMVFWQLLALVPAMIVLVIGSTWVLARPIREIDRAIRQLGQGDFVTPIHVNGPRDLRYLGGQLDWLRLRMVELQEQRNRFLQHMSHELKTPLAAVREGAELLSAGMAGPLDAEQREIAGIVAQRSLQLQRMIETLLDYAAQRFYRQVLNVAPIDLVRIIEHAVAAQSVPLRSKSLHVDVSCADISLRADADKLAVVVDNLLSNAVKHAPAGSTIVISAEQASTSVVVDVVDAGPGVPAGIEGRVFEPFYRGEHADTSLVKGSGLGLSIVKEYVEAHRGTVEVIGAGKPGGHLRVTLPRDPDCAGA